MKNQILLKNINYIDVEQGLIVKNTNILIEDDFIKKIFNELPIDKNYSQIIDCNGKFAVPGLFECHSHIVGVFDFNDEERKEILQEFVFNGITQVRDVGGPLDLLEQMQSDIISNKIIGPDLFYAGPMLEKSPLIWEKNNNDFPGFTIPIDSNSDVDKIIIELKNKKASLIKTFNKFSLDSFKYLIKEAKKIHLPITHDVGSAIFNWIPMNSAIDLGIKCFEHGKAPWTSILKEELQLEHDNILKSKNKLKHNQEIDFFDKIMKLGIESISEKKLHKLANKMLKNDVFLCPTLLVFKLKSDEANNDDKEIFEILDLVSSYCTNELIKFGVKILIGVDSCLPMIFKEMKLLNDLNLSEIEIIKGATKYPAKWLNVYDKYGSISKNKKANLLIVNENPLENIENLTNRFIVIKNGEVVFKNEEFH